MSDGTQSENSQFENSQFENSQFAECQFEDCIATLQALIDTLDDKAMSMLRDTIEAGASKPSVHEKKVVQARRALEKAVTLLRDVTDS